MSTTHYLHLKDNNTEIETSPDNYISDTYTLEVLSAPNLKEGLTAVMLAGESKELRLGYLELKYGHLGWQYQHKPHL
jgi:hypothetical protein